MTADQLALDPAPGSPPPAANRAEWIDALRGLAILAVVFVHSHPGPGPDKYLHVVLVPSFFFSAGLVFQAGKYATWRAFAKRRLRGLVVPYLFFSAVAWAFWATVWAWSRWGLGVRNPELTRMAFAPLVGIPYGAAKFMDYNVPLWFLTCLFSADNLFYFLQKWVKSAGALVAALLGLSLAGFAITRALPLSLPWHVDMALIVLPYYGAGYLFRRRFGLTPRLAWPAQILVAAAALAASLYVSRFNPELRWVDNNIGRWLPFQLTAAGAVVFFSLLAQLLARLRVLGYFGRNSLPLLGLHALTMPLFLAVAGAALGIANPRTPHTTPWALIWATGAILLALPLVRLLNRYAPWAVGRPREKRPRRMEC